MKRILAATTLALSLAVMAAPASADPYTGEPDAQAVSGSILFPTRFTDGTSGWPGLVRRYYDATGTQGNGVIGYVFQVEPASVGGYFTLKVDSQGPANDADLDILFYNELGDTAGSVTPVSTLGYDTHAGSGETGFVPPDSRYGIVYMANGENVAFSYNAAQPYGVQVSETGYDAADITVKAGAWVNFQNVGADFHSVTADDGSFDSSPGTKHPIRPDDTYMAQFLTVGDYAFHDKYSTATGVVHVVAGPGPGTPST
ncbi:MAG: hypothetical protein ABR600_07135 [Actinomycetota bacterium]